MACSCPMNARRPQRITTNVPGTKPVILTVCNCDRLTCRCGAYVDLKAVMCPSGHRQGSLTS